MFSIVLREVRVPVLVVLFVYEVFVLVASLCKFDTVVCAVKVEVVVVVVLVLLFLEL